MKMQEHWTWCREFIDDHCIFRSPPGTGLLISKYGHIKTWQVYMQTAVLDQEFAQRVSWLFWHIFAPLFKKQPFQLCGCESGASPLVCSLQRTALAAGVAVNVFSIKKEAKTYGIKNWCEGGILKDVPVLMVDDVVAMQQTIRTQAKRIAELTKLPLYHKAFSIAACKPQESLRFTVGEQVVDLVLLYRDTDFVYTEPEYFHKYGRKPDCWASLR